MGERIWHIIGMAFVLVAAMLLSPGVAHAGLAGPSLKTCILRDAPGLKPRALFATPERFDCETSQRTFGAGNYWALSQPLPAGDYSVVRMSSVWQDRVTLYVLYADGAIRQTGFTSADTGRRLKLGAAIQVDLPAHTVRPIRLLWHIEGAGNMRGILLGPSIATHEGADHAQLLLSFLYAGILGGAAALLIHNMALLTVLRQPFQAVYCALLTTLLLYTLSISGLLGYMLPGLDNNDRQRLNWLLLGLCGSGVLLFARLFFERRVFAGWLGTISNLVMSALMATSLLAAMLAPWQVVAIDRMVALCFAALMALVPVVMVQAWRRSSQYLWLFALPWAIPIGMASVRTAQALNLLGWNFWLDQSTIISMMLEALVSSLAITYRLRILQQQRDAARQGEEIARALADTDPLTGLANRRAFLRRAIGRPGPQTLLITDIDHFKQINDTVGHDGGDEVLRCFARVLESVLPANALVARIGGEEFAILVDRHIGLPPALLFHALREAPMPAGLTVTTSIGTCTGLLETEEDWKILYRQADLALFAAKAAGRDRARDAGTLQLAA